ncbi:MAG: hypothetical protein LBG83_07565 [Oscillospiraceae bacterium]|jgi:hypothetical protein|nr:hypothetical protein [Oscillospiraceae bacterium]
MKKDRHWKRLLVLGIVLLVAVAFGASGVLRRNHRQAGLETTAEAAPAAAQSFVAQTESTAQAGTTAEPTAPTETSAPESSAFAASTTAATTNTTAETTTAARTPKGKSEIVAYFNQAANRVKTEKPGYSWHDRVLIDRDNMACSNKLLNGAIPTILSIFNGIAKFGQWQPQDSVAAGADHNEFPVSGKSWASKLAPDMVKSAACAEENGSYQIVIVLNDEDVPTLPQDPSVLRTGKVMNAWGYDELVENAKSAEPFVVITNFATNYRDAQVACTIDQATGRLQRVRYTLACEMQIDVKQFGQAHATVPLTREAEYWF